MMAETLLKTSVFERMFDRPFAHASTLIDMGDAGLICAWMGGAYETAPDVSLLYARLRPGSDTWTEPKIIADVPDHSMGQPLFLPRPDGELWFFYNVIMGHDWTTAIPYLKKSRDGGDTWGEPLLLFEYPGLMLRSRALVLPGRIIVPAYDENTWQSRMILSDDDGATWRLSAPMQSPSGNIHPTLVELDDGRLMAYIRTGGKGGVIWRSESHDRGDSWTELTPTTLPNPNSGIDLLRLHSGRFALAFNNSPTYRTPLCVALADRDERWQTIQTIEDEHAEISYPTLAQTGDGMLHLVYTYRREKICYARFSEDWLMQGAAFS
ncbi:exo-alpha-sialidase [Kamptonema cortianum]|jgi:predicted neuraminidase|nr:sialidase family protein [Oscillatoria laete-virens]MDK3158207.1 exo-alpha-sialidase [Kamptonema cortianum]MDL5055451.1 exo-alpha-sialidase [Oscillatoria laete-virens NRMC-F 0139]